MSWYDDATALLDEPDEQTPAAAPAVTDWRQRAQSLLDEPTPAPAAPRPKTWQSRAWETLANTNVAEPTPEEMEVVKTAAPYHGAPEFKSSAELPKAFNEYYDKLPDEMLGTQGPKMSENTLGMRVMSRLRGARNTLTTAPKWLTDAAKAAGEKIMQVGESVPQHEPVNISPAPSLSSGLGPNYETPNVMATSVLVANSMEELAKQATPLNAGLLLTGHLELLAASRMATLGEEAVVMRNGIKTTRDAAEAVRLTTALTDTMNRLARIEALQQTLRAGHTVGGALFTGEGVHTMLTAPTWGEKAMGVLQAAGGGMMLRSGYQGLKEPLPYTRRVAETMDPPAVTYEPFRGATALPPAGRPDIVEPPMPGPPPGRVPVTPKGPGPVMPGGGSAPAAPQTPQAPTTSPETLVEDIKEQLADIQGEPAAEPPKPAPPVTPKGPTPPPAPPAAPTPAPEPPKPENVADLSDAEIVRRIKEKRAARRAAAGGAPTPASEPPTPEPTAAPPTIVANPPAATGERVEEPVTPEPPAPTPAPAQGSYRVRVTDTSGGRTMNQLHFGTPEEATKWGNNLLDRWSGARDFDIVESTEAPTHRWDDTHGLVDLAAPPLKPKAPVTPKADEFALTPSPGHDATVPEEPDTRPTAHELEAEGQIRFDWKMPGHPSVGSPAGEPTTAPPTNPKYPDALMDDKGHHHVTMPTGVAKMMDYVAHGFGDVTSNKAVTVFKVSPQQLDEMLADMHERVARSVENDDEGALYHHHQDERDAISDALDDIKRQLNVEPPAKPKAPVKPKVPVTAKKEAQEDLGLPDAEGNLYVDNKHLTEGTYNHQTNRFDGAGVIARSYSGDKIPEGKIRSIVEVGGRAFVNTGGAGGRSIELWPLVPLAEWAGPVTTYAKSRDSHSYEGIPVRHGKKEYVMGPRSGIITAKPTGSLHEFGKPEQGKLERQEVGPLADLHDYGLEGEIEHLETLDPEKADEQDKRRLAMLPDMRRELKMRQADTVEQGLRSLTDAELHDEIRYYDKHQDDLYEDSIRYIKALDAEEAFRSGRRQGQRELDFTGEKPKPPVTPKASMAIRVYKAIIGKLENLLTQKNAGNIRKMISLYTGIPEDDFVGHAREYEDAIEAALADKLASDYEDKVITRFDPVMSQIQHALGLERLMPNAHRSIEKKALQQFSTPLPIGVAAVQAAYITAEDRVMEPTAGTGNLVASIPDRDRIDTYEIDPHRAELLAEQGYGEQTPVDYLRLDLGKNDRPTVIITNPPWGKYTTGKYGAPAAGLGFTPVDVAERFIAKNLDDLQDGGRLVAIMPTTMLESPSFRQWLAKNYTVQAIIQSPPKAYDTRGTTVESVMLVVDKVKSGAAPAPLQTPETWDAYATAIEGIRGRGEVAEAPAGPDLEDGEGPEERPGGAPEPDGDTGVQGNRPPKLVAGKRGAAPRRHAAPPAPKPTGDGDTPEGDTGGAPSGKPEPLTENERKKQEALAKLRDVARKRNEAKAKIDIDPSAGSGELGFAQALDDEPDDEGLTMMVQALRAYIGDGITDFRSAILAFEKDIGPAWADFKDELELAWDTLQGSVPGMDAARGVDEVLNEDITDRIRRSEFWRPYERRTDIQGEPHPKPVIEAKQLAGVPYPKITLAIPRAFARAAKEGWASVEQVEQALAALQANFEPASGKAHGFLIADNVGVGKSRENALVVNGFMDEAIKAKREQRLLVVTKSGQNVDDLLENFPYVATGRTAAGIDLNTGKKIGEPGRVPYEIIDLRDYKDSARDTSHEKYAPLPRHKHAIYITDSHNLRRYYLSLADVGLHGIVGDEAHSFKNVWGSQGGQAWQGLHAQIFKNVPRAEQRFVYSTATPAQTIGDFEYLYGLRMWPIDGFDDWLSLITGQLDAKSAAKVVAAADTGIKNPDQFATPTATGPQTVGQQIQQGVRQSQQSTTLQQLTPAEMEQIPREFKMLGRMSARDLWREGTEFEVHKAKLSPAQIQKRDEFSQLAHDVYNAVVEFGEMNRVAGLDSRGMAAAALMNAAKRFALQAAMEEAIQVAKEHIEQGFQPVIRVVNVGKVGEVRDVNADGVGEDEADVPIGGHMAGAINMINTKDLDQDDAGNIINNGDIPEAIRAKGRLMERLRDFPLEAPVDMLEAAFGKEKIAIKIGGTNKEMKLGQKEFQQGLRQLMLISGAGSTGINLDHRVRTSPPEGVFRKGAKVSYQGREGTVMSLSPLTNRHASTTTTHVKFDDGTVNLAAPLKELTMVKDAPWAGGRRVMINAQFAWSATDEVQAIGRVDRTSSITPPLIKPITFSNAGEVRFLSVVASRMASLGASSRGGASATGSAKGLDQFEMGGSEMIAAMRHVWTMDTPDSVKAQFIGDRYVDHTTNLPASSLLDGTTSDDIQRALLYVDIKSANEFWQKVLDRRDHLRQTMGDLTAQTRTQAFSGEVLQEAKLNDLLTVYKLKNEAGHRFGLLVGVIMPHMPRIAPSLAVGPTGNPIRRYISFQTNTGRTLTGLEVPWTRIGRIAIEFGKDFGQAVLDTPEKVRDALRAGERVPLVQRNSKNGERWTLRQTQDGHIRIDNAAWVDEKLLTNNGAWFRDIGKYFYVKPDRFDEFIERFPAEHPATLAIENATKDDEPGGGAKGMSSQKPTLNPPPATKPKAPVNLKQQTPSEIIVALTKALGLPTRVGGFRQPGGNKMLHGIFKPREEVIRLRLANDLPVFSHEVGHALDKKYLFAVPRWSTELLPLGAATSTKSFTRKQRLEEGVAEFVRLWLTDPQQAAAKAPNFYNHFEKTIEGDIRKALKEAQQQLRGHVSLDYVDRLKSKISMRGASVNADPRTVWQHIYQRVFDDLSRLQLAVEDMGGTPESVLRDSYKLTVMARGSASVAAGFLEHGIKGTDGKFKTEGLDKILKPIGKRMDDWVAYLVALRGRELAGRGKDTGLTKEEIDATIDRFKNDKDFNTARDKYYKFNDAALEYAYEHGIIDADDLTAMRKMGKYYVPFNRVMDGYNRQLGAHQGRQIANRRSPLRFMSQMPSTRDIINPLESGIRNLHAIVDTVMQNDAMVALVEQAEGVEASGKWLDRVPDQKVAHIFNLDRLTNEILAELKANGVDIPATLDFDRLVKVWMPKTFADGNKGYVTVLRGGKRYFYSINDKPLYDTLTALGPSVMHDVLKLFIPPAALLRATATALNVTFGSRNMLKDSWVAWAQSDYGFRLGYDTVRGLFRAIHGELKGDEEYKQFMTEGVMQASLVGSDRRRLQRDLRKLAGVKPEGWLERMHDTVMTPVDWLQAYSEMSEKATRYGAWLRKREFEEKRGITGPEATARATWEARRSTVDFSVGGSWTRFVNTFRVFISARVGGYRRAAEAAKANPAGFLLKATAGVSMMSVILWWLNHDDDRYNELPAWEKNAFWHIPVGFTDSGFVRVPKPPVIGDVFGTAMEIALDTMFKKDPETVVSRLTDIFGKSRIGGPLGPLFELMMQIAPTAVLPGLEVLFNYDKFRDRALVPPFAEGLEEDLKTTRWTSDTAKALGGLLGMAPIQVEHLIYGYTGGFGRTTLQTADAMAYGVGLTKGRPSLAASRLPLLSAFYREGIDESAESLQQMYRLAKKANDLNSSINRYLDQKQDAKAQALAAKYSKLLDPERVELLNWGVDEMKGFRSEMDGIFADDALNPKQKREALDKLYIDMVNTARVALGKSELQKERPSLADFLKKSYRPWAPGDASSASPR